MLAMDVHTGFEKFKIEKLKSKMPSVMTSMSEKGTRTRTRIKGTVEMIDWGGSGVGYSFIIINH